jgi:hypothetical protein
VILWTAPDFFHAHRTAVELLTDVADRSDFVLIVLTADDEVRSRWSRKSPHLSNPNGMFEIGFLAGRLGFSRIFLVAEELATVEKLPSELAGIMHLSLASEGRSSVGAIAAAAARIRDVVEKVQQRIDRPREFLSCFVSYSWNDKDFAAQLSDDMRQVGIRCWLDAKEIKAGESIRNQLERAIQAQDNVVIVMSQASVRSLWVQKEIEHAFDLERIRQRTVLFPVRLDEAVFSSTITPQVGQLKDRPILDFSDWRDKGRYQRHFHDLSEERLANCRRDVRVLLFRRRSFHLSRPIQPNRGHQHIELSPLGRWNPIRSIGLISVICKPSRQTWLSSYFLTISCRISMALR